MGNTEADCQALVAHLYEFLDGELDEAECTRLQRHIDECGECLNHVGFERGLKELVRRKCSETSPDDLVARLLERLRRD